MNRKSLEFKGNLFEAYLSMSISELIPDSKCILNKEIYSPYLRKDTQIDLIIITKRYVNVIEAKNWDSYIKGTYDDTHWQGKGASQIMTVFNPINQNAIHVRALQKLVYDNTSSFIPCKSFIVVPDGCNIETKCSEVINTSVLRREITKQMITVADKEIDSSYYYDVILNKV